jgi:hypothetical protein
VLGPCQGASVKAVQKQLGHATASITLDTYGHLFPDGEVRQQFSVCFACRLVGGVLAISDESLEVPFLTPAEIEVIPVHESIPPRPGAPTSAGHRLTSAVVALDSLKDEEQEA